MKILLWLVGVIVAVPVLLFGAMYGASELGGEVVTLARADGDGEVSAVRVWIVDEDGYSWIEHGGPDAYWITRLADEPEVLLTRDGRPQTYLGVADPQASDRYRRLRREKYGWADQVVGALGGGAPEGEPGLPVRLQLVQ